MKSFISRRLTGALIAIVGVVTAVFIVQRAVPGDPVDALLGEQATEQERVELRARLGLDQPLSVQYADLWISIFDGTLGDSYDTGAPRSVSSVLAEHVPATVELAVAGVFVAVLLAIPLGLLAAAFAGTAIDLSAVVVALLGVAIPNFWLGPALIYLLSVKWGWLPDPGAGRIGLSSLILPAFVLGTALAGKLALMVRSSVLEVLSQPFIDGARARGLSPWTLWTRHIARNAALPVITIIGLQFAALLTGALITEKVFARPGLGTLLLDATSSRNYPVVQGTVIAMSAAYVVVNLLSDLLYAWVDPRIRYGSGGSA